MSESLRNKLQQAEMNPPAGSWEAIAAAINETPLNKEQEIGQRIAQFELTPPVLAWESIEAAIQENNNQPGKVISFRPWYYAAAAVAVAVLGIWLFRSNFTKTSAIFAEQKKLTAPIFQPLTSAINQAIEKNPFQISSVQKYVPVRAAVTVQPEMIAVSNPDDNTEDLELPSSDVSSIEKVTADVVTEINAPLIKDSKGNIIYDTDLLKQSIKGNYITVTAPDGSTTRISTKFLHQLNYLHTSSTNGPAHPLMWGKNGIWQWQFDRWKKTILYNQEFNPGATNFLDALELLELLNEAQ